MERESMIEEVTKRVLERISVSLDAQQALQEIEKLKKQIEDLISTLSKGGRM